MKTHLQTHPEAPGGLAFKATYTAADEAAGFYTHRSKLNNNSYYLH